MEVRAKNFTEAQLIAKQRGWVTESRTEIDGDGYTVQAWYAKEPSGMSLEDARAHLAESQRERPFGLTWETIERMQRGRISK